MIYTLSKFNEFIFFEKAVVGVNTNTRMLFKIGKEKYNLLLENKDNLSILEKEHPILFSLMKKLGIIVEDDNLEQTLLLQNRQIVFNTKSYRLTINPTLNCNFSCWYCYETHTKKIMSKEAIDATLLFIKNIIKEKKISEFQLDWFGGEPLLCFKNVMVPLCTEAKKICDMYGVKFISGITTNGYLITKDMIPFFKEYNYRSFQITLDGIRDVHNSIRFTHNNRGSFDKIVENVSSLAKELKPENLALRINYTAETFTQIAEIIPMFSKEIRPYITVLLQQVWQDKDNNKIKAEDIEDLKYKFEEVGFRIEKNIFNLRNYTCYADLFYQAVINYDGRVFKCTARNFEEEDEDGLLSEDGDIIWSSKKLAKKISKATFENEKCMNCKYLPLCFGPCSQKISTIETPKDFDKYCFMGGIKESLEYVMAKFYNSEKALASLLDYR